MDWTLTRKEFDKTGIFGRMSDENGDNTMCTLEHAFVDRSGAYCPAVEAGVYLCERRESAHFGFEVFELQAVPGHENIEIHKGNVDADSKGCILLGLTEEKDEEILNSKNAFDHFMELMDGVDQFHLTIQDS